VKTNGVCDMAQVYPNSQQATYAIQGVEVLRAIGRGLRVGGFGNSESLKHEKAQRAVKSFAAV